MTLIDSGGLEQAIVNAKNGLKQYQKGNIGEHFPFTKMHLAIEKFKQQI